MSNEKIMNCIYFIVRSKNMKDIFIAIENKKKITFCDCKNCLCKEYKAMKEIKKKSNK